MANSYLRFPNNFFGGTRALSLEERGAFNDILDIFIARDGDLPDHPRNRAYDLAVDMRVWKRVRNRLIEAGKIEVKDGVIIPRGGLSTLATCLARSVAAREAADSRWRSVKAKPPKLKETNDAKADATAMPLKTRHKSIAKSSNKSISPKKLKMLFEEWYAHYPRKVGRGAAEKQYGAALKKTEQSALVERVMVFALAVADKDPSFIPHPATWLSQERWTDDQAAINPQSDPVKPGASRGGNSSITAASRRFVSGERLR